MNYNASVSDFFKSPQWKSNFLLGAVAILIPLVGPLVLTGWHVTGLWARGDREEPGEFPPFDFQYFAKYLERGLWPFLVNLVASLVLVPVILCMMFPLLIFSGAFDSKQSQAPDGMFIAILLGMFGLQFVLMMAYQLFVTPLMLRATITQDFKSSFDFTFAKSFVAGTWKELLASMVFMFGLGLCLMVLAVVTCYIGAFFAAPVVMFGWHHLQKQLYQLYLVRGGEPVPLSPKLRDIPPPLPAI